MILIPIMFCWCIALTLGVMELWLATRRSDRRVNELTEMLRIAQKGQESMRWSYKKDADK